MENITETNWYKRTCHGCPYFVDRGKEIGISCERPTGEDCLTDGVLVQMVVIKGQMERVQELQQKAEKAFPPIKHKKIKPLFKRRG